MYDEHQIGHRARAARKAQGMTQADVAEAVGIAVEVYGRMERQILLPSVSTLLKIARVLRVTPNDLLGAAAGETTTALRPELRRVHRLLEDIDPKLLPSLGVVLKAMRKPASSARKKSLKRKPKKPTRRH